MALLSHYYKPNMPDGIEELAMTDWIDALQGFPQMAVDDAVREWLRGETRRPTPADLRRRCAARVDKPKPQIPEDQRPFKPVVVTDEQLERRRTVSAKMAEIHSILKHCTSTSQREDG